MKKTIFVLAIILVFKVNGKLNAQSYFTSYNTEVNLQSFSTITGHWVARNPLNNTIGGDAIQGINFGFDANNYVSLANSVLSNELYFGRWCWGWKDWNKIWHSGNLNNSDVDFNAKDIFSKRLYATTNYIENTQFGTNPGLTISLSATGQYNNDNSLVFATSGGILLGGISGRYDSYASGTASGGHLSFYTLRSANAVPLEALRLTNTGNAEFYGNVGIGATDPGSYKLNVAGSIRANEIKINTTGADFVFEPTYKLRSLAEVENFIKQNKHLPDVAPAADMQTNGVSMGEMQAKLLQKVEELTLYSIEQEKKLQEQRQSSKDLQLQLAAQAKEIEQLKQLITQKLK